MADYTASMEDIFRRAYDTTTQSLRIYNAGGTYYPEVANYSALPAAADHTGETYVAIASEGVFMINRKEKGLYRSDGASWTRLGNIPGFFETDAFKVYDSTTNAAAIKFNVSNLSTTRTLTFSLDQDYTLPAVTPDKTFDLPAGAWDYPTTAPAYLDTDSGTNGTIKRHIFPPTTEYFVEAQVMMPSNLDTSGNAKFEVWGYPSAWTTNARVQFKVYNATTGAATWDRAYTAYTTGDFNVNSVGQDVLDHYVWTSPIATLSWNPDDFSRIKFSRVASAVSNAPGDFGVTYFRLSVPRV